MSLTRTDLVIIPCCDSKRGTGKSCNRVEAAQLLGEKAAALLREGRKIALKNQLDLESELMPFLYRYSGFLYTMPGFRRYVRRLLRKDVHVLILSGGYGFLHPLERGHNYNVRISSTTSVWRDRLPKILADYITRNGIERVFVAGSSGYAKVLEIDLRVWATDVQVYWFVSRYDGQGNRYQNVSHQIGRAIFGLSCAGELDPRWKRKPPRPS